MENYKPNSHKSKEEQNQAPSDRKIEKVVKGTAKVKKKNGIVKFADTFISEDVSNVKTYVVGDVLVPAVKKLFFDIVTGGLDMILYGGRGSGTRRTGLADKVSYSGFYGQKTGSRLQSEPRAKSRFDYDNIAFNTRGEAEAALDQMQDVISTYGFVTVADMYDMADLSAPFTSNKYGWTNIRNAEVVRTFDGDYVIKLPKAVPLD